MYYTAIYSDEYLAHHGVLGMKWGVWNEETRARYSGHRSARKARKEVAKARYDERKDVRTMSDKDLKDRIERLRNEKTYKELLEEDLHPGRAAAKQVLGQSVKKVAGITLTAAGIATVALVCAKFAQDCENDAAIFQQMASEAQTQERAQNLMNQAMRSSQNAAYWRRMDSNLKIIKK